MDSVDALNHRDGMISESIMQCGDFMKLVSQHLFMFLTCEVEVGGSTLQYRASQAKEQLLTEVTAHGTSVVVPGAMEMTMSRITPLYKFGFVLTPEERDMVANLKAGLEITEGARSRLLLAAVPSLSGPLTLMAPETKKDELIPAVEDYVEDNMVLLVREVPPPAAEPAEQPLPAAQPTRGRKKKEAFLSKSPKDKKKKKGSKSKARASKKCAAKSDDDDY